jgi:dynactin 1
MDFQFQINDIVDVNGVKAVVRFYGPTEFMPGTDWVGVELESPTGKNNGTVQGVQYFTCRDKYGMFVKPSMPRLIERPVQRRQQPQPQTPMSPAQRKASGRVCEPWNF